jgi:hypothetical protein
MRSFYNHINNITEESSTEVIVEKVVDKSTLPACNEFVSFCKDFLKLKSKPKITFIRKLDGHHTTGGYHPSDRKITIYVQDRALVDVLRSIAHELVHQKQHEDDRLNISSGETGSPEENEANALAGILMRHFQKKNRDIY